MKPLVRPRPDRKGLPKGECFSLTTFKPPFLSGTIAGVHFGGMVEIEPREMLMAARELSFSLAGPNSRGLSCHSGYDTRRVKKKYIYIYISDSSGKTARSFS